MLWNTESSLNPPGHSSLRCFTCSVPDAGVTLLPGSLLQSERRLEARATAAKEAMNEALNNEEGTLRFFFIVSQKWGGY